MANLCIWNSGLTALKRIKLELAETIKGGKVLDLGSGENPFGFSFAYAAKVDELNFSDKNDNVIAVLQNKISYLDPDDLNETDSEFLEYLGLNSMETIAHIIEKTNEILNYDFSQKPLERTFDVITAFECIASVNSFDIFQKSFHNCAQMLKQNGRLLGVSTRYETQNDRTLELIKSGNEGTLNPDLDAYKKAFKDAGLEINLLEKRQLEHITNYNEVIIFDVRK
ncbi:MAG: methyltransferase domain-containing protein [Alphaproteobacteria bacterium]